MPRRGVEPRRQSHEMRPAATARMGPSSGTATTTSAPRRTALSTDSTRRGSPASSPADDHVQRPRPTRASGRVRGAGNRPNLRRERARSWLRVERHQHRGSVRALRGRRPANREMTPSPTADAVARICAPPMATERSSPSESAADKPSLSSRSRSGIGAVISPHPFSVSSSRTIQHSSSTRSVVAKPSFPRPSSPR